MKKRQEIDRPMHFICAHKCRWHRATWVGDVVVSSVGDMYHEGRREEIGLDRFYETMVFRYSNICRDPACSCGGLPVIIPSEIDFSGYNTEAAADEGHEAMVQKWAAMEEGDE